MPLRSGRLKGGPELVADGAPAGGLVARGAQLGVDVADVAAVARVRPRGVRHRRERAEPRERLRQCSLADEASLKRATTTLVFDERAHTMIMI